MSGTFGKFPFYLTATLAGKEGASMLSALMSQKVY